MVERAALSVLSQTFSDYELIVVDDGSFDGTDKIISNLDKSINYIYQKNKGVSSARNIGVARSNGKYIAFLDSDDTWDEHKLEKNYDFIQNNGRFRIHQSDDIWIRNNIRVNPPAKYLKQTGDIFSQSLELCSISPSSVVIDRNIFSEYGLFDEMMPACEDYDMWIRITPFEEVGLISDKLITRYSGHDDQLTMKYWGMDRFRLYSLLKLLKEKGEDLSADKLSDLESKIIEKIHVLSSGAAKRNNERMLHCLKKISINLEMKDYTQTGYPALLNL